MKTQKLLILAGIALSSGWQAAQAQLAPDANVGGQMQDMIAAFQQRLQNAGPEERAQLMQMRAQFEARLQAQGVDTTNPAAVQQALAQMVGRGGGGNGGGGGGRGGNQMGGRGGRGGGMMNVPLTPEQKDAQRRQLMIAAGISSKNDQDDILAFINAEEKAREPLLKLARASAASLNANTVRLAAISDKTDENEQKVDKVFKAYTDALEADKIRHEAALKSLDASIGYQSNPRLKAFLTLVGVIDNDALAIGGASAIFANIGPAPTTPAAGNFPRQTASAATAAAPAIAAAPGAAPAPAVGGFGALPPVADTGQANAAAPVA